MEVEVFRQKPHQQKQSKIIFASINIARGINPGMAILLILMVKIIVANVINFGYYLARQSKVF
ncbi:MAG: hypothetical protein K6F33_01555 [Bacteroidales bacterium]|nr:hypothetical protein [Bacteroidales bacterium]